jgi:hypothetical protein
MATIIKAGMQVRALTAFGEWVPKITTSGIEPGHTFPVIWVRQPEGDADEAVPWPADDVRPGWEEVNPASAPKADGGEQ